MYRTMEGEAMIIDKENFEAFQQEFDGLAYLVGHEWGGTTTDPVEVLKRAKALLEGQGRDNRRAYDDKVQAIGDKIVSELGIEPIDYQLPNGIRLFNVLSFLRVLYIRLKRKTDPSFILPRD